MSRLRTLDAPAAGRHGQGRTLPLRVVTRGSPLALWQTRHFLSIISGFCPVLRDAEAFLAQPRDPVLPTFLVFERTDSAPELVGSCGLGRRPSGAIELGYWIARPHWGRGYATEASGALIDIARTLGFTRDELMSKRFIEFVHPDDRERTLLQNHGVRGGGQARSFENRYMCRDGSYRWLLWNATPDPGRQVIYGVARDITEPKHAEDERDALVRQVTGTVRWRASVAWMAGAGVDAFVEVGSGKVLTGLVKRIAAGAAATRIGRAATRDSARAARRFTPRWCARAHLPTRCPKGRGDATRLR